MSVSNRRAESSGRQLVLTTLGAVSLTLEHPGDAPPVSFPVGKPAALITYLAFAPGRCASREHIIDLLWSDLDREAGQHALRLTLSRLRKAFGSHLDIAGYKTLVLRSDVVTDRDAFQAAAERRDFGSAVRLYTGDFFPGFAAPGAAEFEQWAEIERQTLRTTFVRCAEALVREWLKAARFREATALARRIRDAVPLHQPGWRLLLETLIAGREATLAAVEADRLERLLAQEEMQPEPSTRSLLNAARRSESEQGAATDAEQGLIAELVGREREFSAIISAWERARVGTYTHLHVTAPAGMGKTRLLNDVHARLRAMRARVVHVRGNLGARDLPYALASDLAAGLAELPGARGVSTGAAGALVALNPTLSSYYSASYSASPDRSDGDEALRRRAVAVRELIVAVADENPVALLVDDVQWADSASRMLLGSVLGGLGGHRVLVVSAARPYAKAKLAGSDTIELTLAPLSLTEIGALMASLGELPDEPWVKAVPEAMHQASDGSPLLVLENLQLALDRGLLERGRKGWSSPDPGGLFDMLLTGGALRHRLQDGLAADGPLLTLLAVAGVPLATDVLARAATAELREVEDRLVTLERRNLVTRAGGRWQLMHDEYVPSVLESATPDALRAAHAAIGRVLFEDAGVDVRRMREAAAHLAPAGEHALLHSLFVRFVTLARRSGDHRSNRTLARELGCTRGVAAALGGCLVPVVIALAVTAARQPPPPPPDAVLVVAHSDSSGEVLLHQFPLHRTRWALDTPLELHLEGEPRWRLSIPARSTHVDGLVHGYPDAEWWTGYWAVADSGVGDIFSIGPGGRTRRLTWLPADDVAPKWAPDGSHLVFQAGGFHPLRHADIAVLDTATGAVRQLTSGDETDNSPVWSPDGTRIAFARKYWDARRGALCVVNVDGSQLRCARPDTLVVRSALAWSDDRHVLVHTGSWARPWLVRMDVETGGYQVLDSTPGTRIVSPDGRWVVCACARRGFPDGAWFVHPVDSPDQIRHVHVMGAGSRWQLIWAKAPGKARYLDRLAIDAGDGEPIRGLPYQLRASGYDLSGTPVRLATTSWRSLDTLIATVDSAGLLTPRRAGRVAIEISAGGWRTATRTLTVRDAPVRTLLSEDWRSGLEREWIPYGEPRPAVVRASDGSPAFWNGNDGRYTSGVYSKRTYSSENGLGIEVRLSTRVTLMQWQEQIVGFFFGADSGALATWDHRTGYPPFISKPSVGSCFATYPGGGEGHTYADSIHIGGGFNRAAPVPRDLRTGRWFTLRIQVFPDGRCAFAVDGRPLVISPRQALAGTWAHVMLDGKSYETQILVGPLTIFTGVPTDIDWGLLYRPSSPAVVTTSTRRRNLTRSSPRSPAA